MSKKANGSMGALIKVELRKLAASPLLYLALAVGVFLGLADAATTIVGVMSEAGEEDADLLWSCYAYWMSVRYSTVWATLLYYVLPLLAVIPYAWSLAGERASGYVVEVYSRASRGRYFGAKALAAFLVGGAVAVIPQVLNFLTLMAFFPLAIPDVFDAMYLGIFEDNLWAELFYSVPALYVALYLLLDFLYCGLWAVLVLAIGYTTKNRVVVLAAPYLALVILQFVNERIFFYLGGIRGIQLSVFENLHAYSVKYVQSGGVILAELVLMLVAALLLAWYGARKDEL